MIKLFSAFTQFGDIHREGQTTINWLAFREEPIAPYESLISNYGVGSSDRQSQERAVNQYFTFDELRELAIYLEKTRGWNLKYREAKIPRDFHIPYPIYSRESAVLLYEEDAYDLGMGVVGSSSFTMLPGLSLEEIDDKAMETNALWIMFFLEELFKKLNVGLSNQGVFSQENLYSVCNEIFYESGFYVHKFGVKDTLATITPEEHIARIEKNKELKLQIEEWTQQQADLIEKRIQQQLDSLNNNSDIEGMGDF